jgi:hypothetical protein
MSSNVVLNGKYNVTVSKTALAYSSKNKTPSIKILLVVDSPVAEPENKINQFISYDLWITQGTIINTKNCLKYVFGFDGDDISVFNNPDQFSGTKATAVIEMEEYEGKSRPRVRFLNALFSVKPVDAMSAVEICKKFNELSGDSGVNPPKLEDNQSMADDGCPF